MSLNPDSLLVYAITDRQLLEKNNPGMSLSKAVDLACKGGATMIQLREKISSLDEFLSNAFELRKITNLYGIPLIVNDNLEIALKCGADGVHVGQSDMPAAEVRKKIGSDLILGVSARTVEQANRAAFDGADYIGAGDVFGTRSKDDTQRISYDIIKAICSSIDIPVIAIGGITVERLKLLAGTGIKGTASISAIFGASDIESAAASMKNEMLKIVRKTNLIVN